MDGRKRLPDAELSVMQAVWAHGGEVSRGDIEGALASHGWSINTINTYDVMKYNTVIATKAAVEKIEEVYA